MTHALPPLPLWVHLVLWAVVLGAVLRVVYGVAWLIPHRDAAVTRHPAGRHRAPKELQR